MYAQNSLHVLYFWLSLTFYNIIAEETDERLQVSVPLLNSQSEALQKCYHLRHYFLIVQWNILRGLTQGRNPEQRASSLRMKDIVVFSANTIELRKSWVLRATYSVACSSFFASPTENQDFMNSTVLRILYCIISPGNLAVCKALHEPIKQNYFELCISCLIYKLQ